MAKNCVLAGDYSGSSVVGSFGTAQIAMGFKKGIPLDHFTVETYELITDEHRKSAASGATRGIIGGALLGPVGMLAGGLSAKNKGTYQVAIQFKDGKRSLLEVDNNVYKAIVQACFRGSSISGQNNESGQAAECTKCGKGFEGKFCPECGQQAVEKSPAPQQGQPSSQTQPPQQSPYYNQPSTNPPRKKKGCLLLFLIIMGMVCALFFSIISKSGQVNTPPPPPAEVPIVFDASVYAAVDGKNISEAALIEKLGEPDSIQEWNHKTLQKTFPIRTLYYGTQEYNFNNDNLQRITLIGKIPYESKDNFLKMFGLQEYKNTKITDTNVAYRAYDCGVHDLWLLYEDGEISMAKISYGSVFSE